MSDTANSERISVEAVAAAHRQLVADGITQFDLPAYVPPRPPGWVQPLLEWLARSGPLIKFVFWAGLAVTALLILWGLYNWLAPMVRQWRARTDADAMPDTWSPDAAPARALLAEAEALAAKGAFAEAAHLLLLRSVEQIEARHPGSLTPSDTSRDIARAPILNAELAQAFRFIAGVVEAGLFAGREVSRDAWNDCRRAYEAAAFGKTPG